MWLSLMVLFRMVNSPPDLIPPPNSSAVFPVTFIRDKTRSPEFYKELAAKGVAARQAKWDLVKRTKEDDEEETKMKAEAAKNAP